MKKKITFFLFALNGGGAERTIINIMNNLDNNKFCVTLILGTNKNNDYINLIDERIKIIHLNSSKLRFCVPKLRKAILKEQPDLLFSTINSNNIIILISNLLTFNKTPVIVRESSNRTQAGSVTKINRLVTRLVYNNLASKVIALSKGVKKDLISNFRIKENKIAVVYNPVETKEIERLSQDIPQDIHKKNNQKYVVAAGRLVEAKDFKTLIKSFQIISNEVDSKLLILGKGPKEEELIQQAEDLKVRDKIIFLGFQENPYKYMNFGDIFILSSRWEGFGHVIVEAMASGTPVVSTDCKSGPGEIITQDLQGKLVPVGDYKEMAQVTISLLKNDKLLSEMQKEAKKRSNNFNVKKILTDYENTFFEVIKQSK